MLLEDHINVARTQRSYEIDISSCPKWIKEANKELEKYREYSLIDGKVTYGEHDETYNRLLFAVNSFYANNDNMVEKYKPYILKSLFNIKTKNQYEEQETIKLL